MLRLGNISLDVPFFQAPLSGYSDYAMRTIARRFNCPVTFAGVILAKSAANPKVLAKKVFRPGDDEHPVGAQILGNESQEMAKAAKDLVSAGYDIIDLNFACPAPKVLRRGRGGALMDEPEKAVEIIKMVRSEITCPLMIKLRAGRDKSNESKGKFWQIIEGAVDAGVDAITVHGRMVQNNYRGKADWQIVGQVKRRFGSLTVIGSGDLLRADRIIEVLNGVDGAAIARGAIGNPWIFRELRAHFDGNGKYEAPTMEEQEEVILHHFELVCRLYPDKKAVRYFRKFLTGYCKSHPQRKAALVSLMEVRRSDEFIQKVKHFFSGEQLQR